MDGRWSKQTGHSPAVIASPDWGCLPSIRLSISNGEKIIPPRVKSREKFYGPGEGERTAMGNMVLGTNRLVDLVASDGGHESYTILSNQRPIESSPSAILAEHEMSGIF